MLQMLYRYAKGVIPAIYTLESHSLPKPESRSFIYQAYIKRI
jgi:hypothetical protein